MTDEVTITVDGQEVKTTSDKMVIQAANEAGILLNGPRPHTIRFMPPLNITKEEIDQGTERLGNALATI